MIWNVRAVGRGSVGGGLRLEPVTRLHSFWFVWVGFQPETRLVE